MCCVNRHSIYIDAGTQELTDEFEVLVKRAIETHERETSQEEQLGDIPDEFLGMHAPFVFFFFLLLWLCFFEIPLPVSIAMYFQVYSLCAWVGKAFGNATTDPITCCLMEEPVTLPTSGKVLAFLSCSVSLLSLSVCLSHDSPQAEAPQIVDRSTITRHLLSDQTDPFNRAKLTVDMLQPSTPLSLCVCLCHLLFYRSRDTDVELKRQIEEWKLKKKAEKAQQNPAS